MDGLIGIVKPVGIVSSDVVTLARHALTCHRIQTSPESLPKKAAQKWIPPSLSDSYFTSMYDMTSLTSAFEKSTEYNVDDVCVDVVSERVGKKGSYVKWPFSDIKVGHGGTLDPLASGVLVLGIGSGTKQLQNFLTGNSCRKTYVVRLRFGYETDSYDVTGRVVEKAEWKHITQEQIEQVLKTSFTGNIMQKPPIFSALRVNGKRMYDIARQASNDTGKKNVATDLVKEKLPKIEARPVFVESTELIALDLPFADIRITCGGGTYIRSIVHDLGIELDSIATMVSLERTEQGIFSMDQNDKTRIPCIKMEELLNVSRLEEHFTNLDYQQKIKDYLRYLTERSTSLNPENKRTLETNDDVHAKRPKNESK